MSLREIEDKALRTKKGVELLQKEAKNISVPDINAPLGSKKKIKLDLQNASPNEILDATLEMDKKIADNARLATEKAKTKGIKIDISSEKEMVKNATKNGDVPEATGERMLKQLENIGDDPVKVHDWVQDINVKYGKKYQRGTIDDTITGKLADDIAEQFRIKLNGIVDRKGYAEAYANNQEFKRTLVKIAKKANKGVNFGDISTDAGLDLAISILTGNPMYMARTAGTGLLKGLFSGIRNKAGIKSLKSAFEIAEKLPTKTKLPSTSVKLPTNNEVTTTLEQQAKGIS